MDTNRGHGEQQTKQSRWGFHEKTVWNWLELLVVPLALAVIGFLFSVQQDTRQQRIETQRAEAERELAVQRAQDKSLQVYLDQMSTLMLEKNLRNSEGDSEVRTLARARTLTVLRRLDASRKEEVMNFLVEADLVRGVGGSAPVIELGSADLHNTWMIGADLRGADLSTADLEGALLSSADLRGADLNVASLDNADLYDADLRDASLIAANLEGARLDDADLEGANLNVANLKDAEGWTEDQLNEAENLEGATMPDGQILKDASRPDRPTFEDWHKDK